MDPSTLLAVAALMAVAAAQAMPVEIMTVGGRMPWGQEQEQKKAA